MTLETINNKQNLNSGLSGLAKTEQKSQFELTSKTNNKYSTSPIRSFVKRLGRMTSSQKKSLSENVGYILTNEQIKANPNWQHVFNLSSAQELNLGLDIGFGMGDATIAIALANPQMQFLSIDVHTPGIGRLAGLLAKNNIHNVRIINADVVELLSEKNFDNCLHCVKILFPDPWPKFKHHKRRLINQRFIELLSSKICDNGFLHIATDDNGYQLWINNIMQSQQYFRKISDEREHTYPQLVLPMSKFYQRAINSGRVITNFYYQK